MTPFFKYDDLTSDDLARYYGFKAHNENILANLGKKDARSYKFTNDTKLNLPQPEVCVRERITPKII